MNWKFDHFLSLAFYGASSKPLYSFSIKMIVWKKTIDLRKRMIQNICSFKIPHVMVLPSTQFTSCSEMTWNASIPSVWICYVTVWGMRDTGIKMNGIAVTVRANLGERKGGERKGHWPPFRSIHVDFFFLGNCPISSVCSLCLTHFAKCLQNTCAVLVPVITSEQTEQCLESDSHLPVHLLSEILSSNVYLSWE